MTRKKTLTLLHFYKATLLRFKEYLQIFQQNKPLLHRIYDEQQMLIQWFLICSYKSEVVKQYYGRYHTCQLDKEDNKVRPTELFMGVKTMKLFSDVPSMEGTIHQYPKERLQGNCSVYDKEIVTWEYPYLQKTFSIGSFCKWFHHHPCHYAETTATAFPQPPYIR